DVGQVHVGQSDRDRDHLVEGQFAVGGAVSGDRFGDPVELARTGQDIVAGHLVGQGGHEHLLAVDPADVAAVTDLIPCANEGQGFLTVQYLVPRVQVQAGTL